MGAIFARARGIVASAAPLTLIDVQLTDASGPKRRAQTLELIGARVNACVVLAR